MSDILEKSLIEWAATRNDDVVFNPRDGYYSFDIVADAFEHGKSLGKTQVKGELVAELRKRFVQGLKTAASAMNEVHNELKKQGFITYKAFINHSLNETAIIISVDETTFTSDTFIDFAFSLASDIQLKYAHEQFNINLSYIEESEDLDYDQLKCDGFNFIYDLINEKHVDE